MSRLLTFFVFVLMGSVALAEGITNSELIHETQRNLGVIERCFSDYLRREPGPKRRVVFDFTVLPSGHVTSIIFRTNDFGDARFYACITSNVASWKFPAHKSHSHVKDFHLDP